MTDTTEQPQVEPVMVVALTGYGIPSEVIKLLSTIPGWEVDIDATRWTTDSMDQATFQPLVMRRQGTESVEAQAWHRAAATGLYGIKDEWLGRTYQSRSKRFTIIGWSPGRAKNNVLIRDQNGRSYVTSPGSLPGRLLDAGG